MIRKEQPDPVLGGWEEEEWIAAVSVSPQLSL